MSDDSLAVAEIWGVVIGLGLVAAIVGTVVFALMRAARHAPNAMITISLSVLTLVSLAGFIATANDTLGAIAAGGVGALGGALTALFQQQQPTEDPATTEEE